MSILTRVSAEFAKAITCVSVDERFAVVGQEDGSVTALYHKNGARVFTAKESDNKITAVCCEEKDQDDNPIFYAGDRAGNVYTLNRKGKVLAMTQIPDKRGGVLTIVNRSKFSLHVYTLMGSSTFSNCTKKYQKGKFSTSSAEMFLSEDHELTKRSGMSDKEVKVNQYDCKSSSVVVATWGIEFGRKVKNYTEVLAFGVFDKEYEKVVTEGRAEKTLTVISRNVIRTLEFSSPVRQVMSCRHHEGEAQADRIVILLCDGQILQVFLRPFTIIAKLSQNPLICLLPSSGQAPVPALLA